MASDVEPEPVIFDGSRQASDVAQISFQNLRLIAVAGELVPCGQTGRSGSDNYHPMMVDIRQMALPCEGPSYTRIESRVKNKLQGRQKY